MGLKVGWYSGNSNLPAGFDLSCFDYVKLGPYIYGLGGLKSPETNQKLFRVIPKSLIGADGEPMPEAGNPNYALRYPKATVEDEKSPDGQFVLRRIFLPKSFLE